MYISLVTWPWNANLIIWNDNSIICNKNMTPWTGNFFLLYINLISFKKTWFLETQTWFFETKFETFFYWGKGEHDSCKVLWILSNRPFMLLYFNEAESFKCGISKDTKELSISQKIIEWGMCASIAKCNMNERQRGRCI